MRAGNGENIAFSAAYLSEQPKAVLAARAQRRLSSVPALKRLYLATAALKRLYLKVPALKRL